MGIFDKIFGRESQQSSHHASVLYKGLTILPTPKQGSSGWSTEAIISDPENSEHSHHFIRADTSPTEDSAVELTISKCRILIDQKGPGIFS
ncbi:MAG: HlyU family transcriptional regulator [Pseudomonadota bacterium]